LGGEGLEWLTQLFNDIRRTAKMPREWRFSTVIPLFLWMSPDRELMTSWSDRDLHWNLEVLE